MNYQYTFDAGQLIMSGEINLSRKKNLNNFNLTANLINESGLVLQAVRIAAAGGRRKTEVIPFNSEINAPEGTWGVAFSYSGTTRGTGQDAGSPKRFWHTAF